MIYQPVYKAFAVLSLSVLGTALFSAVVIPSFLCHVLVGPDLGHSEALCGFGFLGPVLGLTAWILCSWSNSWWNWGKASRVQRDCKYSVVQNI